MTGISPPREEALLESACSAFAIPSVDCGGMLLPDPTRRPVFASRMKAVLFLVFLCALAALAGARLPASLQGTDFPDFYCAARMLAEGQGHHLYDADLQRQYQARYAGRLGTLYIHPPFEALIYLATAWLPLKRAYLLWSLLNVAFLAAALRRLGREALFPWDWRVCFAATLTFIPVLLCLLQGQDSLLLLWIVVLAFTALRREQPFAAGCWLALGLFKFQIVLPLLLVLVLTQSKKGRSRLAMGFGVVGVALLGLSAAISGWSVFSTYPRFLAQLRAQPFAGIVPLAMANFRGLAYFFFRHDNPTWAIAAVAILSTAALVKAFAVWKNKDEFDLAFANSLIFALLASYHLNPHDLSLLLLPLSLLLHRARSRTPRLTAAGLVNLGLIGILLLPPLHLWGLKEGVYALVSLPLLLLFLASGKSGAQENIAPHLT